jgi:GNAT superfamily N-acetyltransferase
MAANYEIVHYRPGLKNQVIELQTHLWSPEPSLNKAYFEWKYEQNPYNKEHLIYLAIHDGKAVGMRGFFGVRWECGVPAQRFTSLYADDMVIAPEHRGRGLMAKIMTSAFEDLAARGYDYVFNLSAGPATLHSSLSMGWQNAGWVRPMHRQSWLNALKYNAPPRMKKVLSFAGRLVGIDIRRLKKPLRTLDTVESEQSSRTAEHPSSIAIEKTPRCSAMAELVERIGSSGRLCHVRDSEYFRWRFENPLRRYRYIYWEEDRLEGYIVLQEQVGENVDRNLLNIVDCEATGATVLEHLLQVATTIFAHDRELRIWSATLPQSTIALLRNHGFRTVKPPTDMTTPLPAILVRPVAGYPLNREWTLGGQRLLDLASWEMRMLYSMHG